MTAESVVSPVATIGTAAIDRRRWLDGAVVLALVALANGLLVTASPFEIRLTAALVLFVVLPGHLFVQAVFNGPRPGALERRLLALGCGYVVATLLALVLYILFRPLHTAQILAGADLMNAGLLAGALARRAELRPRLTLPGWPLLLVLAVAAPLRLLHLGYSEFQGDEAEVALRTLAVLQGLPDALIAHRKPPGEILLSTIFAGGLGAITELGARLPFALAGVAAVAAFYSLGRTLFGARAALAAALLLAVNGYFVAFGRILQYQSLGLLVDTLATFCLFRFAQGSAARRGYAVVGALLLAGSGLTALSGLFLLPMAAVALWPRIVGPKRASWRDIATWLWPLILLAPAALAVYGFLARGTGDTLDLAGSWLYLGPRLGERRPYFNLDAFLLSANHYLSSPYLLAVLGAGVLLPLGAVYRRWRSGRSRVPAGPGSVRRSLGWQLALVWLAVPLAVHLFLVRVPGTHWREVFPGLLLLVGAAAAGAYARLTDRRAAAAAVLAGGLFLAASGHYVYVAFVQPWPEYQSLYPLHRHPLDWSRLQAHGAGGTYGAARHHGWKTVAELMASGQLSAVYDTNESLDQAAWYLKRPRACGAAVELFIQAPTTLREYRAIGNGAPRSGYVVAGRVEVDGRPTLALLARTPPADGPVVYRADDGGLFDRELASPWSPVGRLYWPKERRPRCSGAG